MNVYYSVPTQTGYSRIGIVRATMTALPATTHKLNLRRRTRDEVAPPRAQRGKHSDLVRKAAEDTFTKHDATFRALAEV